MIRVVITIGGKGSRLHSFTYSIIPKGLCRIIDKPLLSYQLFSLKKSGVQEVLISAEADWQIAELKQSARIGEFPKLEYAFTKHEYGHPLNPLKTFRVKEVNEFIGENDFMWTYGDLFYDVELLKNLFRIYLMNNTSVACSASPNNLTPLSGGFISYNLDKNGKVVSYHKTARPNLTIDAPFIFRNNVLRIIEKEAKKSHPRGTRLVNSIIDQSKLILIKPKVRININTAKDVLQFKKILLPRELN